MLYRVGLNEIFWLVLLILVGGVISGLLAGLFGVSGGSIVVPVLFECFRAFGVPEDVRMQLCLGTSIAIVIPTTIRSYLTHRTHGLVIPGVIRQWALPSIVGVGCSATIAAFAPVVVLTVAFIVIASVIALKMLFAGDRLNIGHELPGTVPMILYGFGIGLCGSLMGVSGGAISTIVLTLYGKPIHNAIATSSGVAVPISIAGAIGFALAGLPHQAQLPPFSLGFVSLIGVVVVAPVASFMAPYGARFAHRLSRRQLEVAFGCFLLLVSLRFVINLI
jgi:uncharacterized protein